MARGAAWQAGDDGLGIRHLRHLRRVDEACDLDAPRPGLDRAADQFDLVAGRKDMWLVLQAVARGNFDQFDLRHLGYSIGALRITVGPTARSEEHTSELQSLMRISYAFFCLKKKKNSKSKHTRTSQHYKACS